LHWKKFSFDQVVVFERTKAERHWEMSHLLQWKFWALLSWPLQAWWDFLQQKWKSKLWMVSLSVWMMSWYFVGTYLVRFGESCDIRNCSSLMDFSFTFWC